MTADVGGMGEFEFENTVAFECNRIGVKFVSKDKAEKEKFLENKQPGKRKRNASATQWCISPTNTSSSLCRICVRRSSESLCVDPLL